LMCRRRVLNSGERSAAGNPAIIALEKVFGGMCFRFGEPTWRERIT